MTSSVLSPTDKAAFVSRYGAVYEHSPWIAETFFELGGADRRFDASEFSCAMAEIVNRAGEDKQLSLLKAHPDLAGKLAAAGALTAASDAEQSGAGLDQCTPEELSEFQSLNDHYTEKFDFPFILAVAGRNRQEILEIFRSRVGNTKADEFSTALAEVHKIARLRLKKMESGAA